MSSPRAGRRGSAAIAAMIAAGAVATVMMIGLDARISELGHEERPRCRLQARLAAESAIDRAMARLAAGKSPSFSESSLGDGVEYGIKATRNGAGWHLDGLGRCVRRDRGTSVASLRVEVVSTGGHWQVTDWQEGPAD